MENAEQNLAQTLAEHMKKPEILTLPEDVKYLKAVALPPNWKKEEINLEKYLPAPLRKQARVSLDDAPSFIEYFKRHGSLAHATIWGRTNFDTNETTFIGVMNDNGEEENVTGWRDHVAEFKPRFSEEWKRWNKAMEDGAMSQIDFAEFLENNRQDVVSNADGLPSGGEMLEMALSFEAAQDMRFKSAIRLQSGAIDMAFVQSDNDQTVSKMKMFDRFKIGIPVFLGGDAYSIEGRLRYRVPGGTLKFHIDLIRTDRVLDAAMKGLCSQIATATGKNVFAGNPFAR